MRTWLLISYDIDATFVSSPALRRIISTYTMRRRVHAYGLNYYLLYLRVSVEKMQRNTLDFETLFMTVINVTTVLFVVPRSFSLSISAWPGKLTIFSTWFGRVRVGFFFRYQIKTQINVLYCICFQYVGVVKNLVNKLEFALINFSHFISLYAMKSKKNKNNLTVIDSENSTLTWKKKFVWEQNHRVF